MCDNSWERSVSVLLGWCCICGGAANGSDMGSDAVAITGTDKSVEMVSSLSIASSSSSTAPMSMDASRSYSLLRSSAKSVAS